MIKDMNNKILQYIRIGDRVDNITNLYNKGNDVNKKN